MLSAQLMHLVNSLTAARKFSVKLMACLKQHDVISENDVCITGISGMFPKAKNFSEFEEKIYNKVDMSTAVNESSRYYRDYNIPPRLGIVDDIEFFDASFFGIHQKQANMIDPQGRLAIEKCYEAIVDAGINPREMRGTKTAVFFGVSGSESELEISRSDTEKSPYLLLGTTRSLLANRISYALDLKGPSLSLDTACSTTLYALDVAYGAILRDSCDAAIVVCTNLAVNGRTTELFHSLGVLSPEAYCRPFDDTGNGYVRSETISAILMQRAKDAKRIYLKVVHSRTNSDGYKPEGITYPSRAIQERLLDTFYKEINFDTEKIAYYEAHATGTLVGDPIECEAIDNVICKTRKTPLLVGGVKGNVGHAETASGFASIGKLLLASERREIAPTNNYNSPRKEIKSLMENRMKVVSEITKLEGSFLSMSSFGFGGSNAHTLFAVNPTSKDNQGLPTDSLPRLVCWASRTKEGVEKMLLELTNKPLDAEFVALIHNIQRVEEPGFHFRGYGLFGANLQENAICLDKSGSQNVDQKKPIIFLYSGMGSQWSGMAKTLLELPLFKETINKCHDVLVPVGVDLISILTTDDPDVFDSVLNSFVGIAAIQIAITDILKKIGILPDYIIGHSVGEVGCSYADGCSTLEETMLTSYYRGKASLSAKLAKGGMAAVGLGYNQLSTLLPPSVEIACHNSPTSSTISGPKEDVNEFVKSLKEQNIFAKEVNSSGIAYHSRYIKPVGEINLFYLSTVITNPKKRSSKWLSSSVPRNKWDVPETQFASPFYFNNNLLGPVLFDEATDDLPKNGIMIEIGPHGLLQAIVKKSLSTLTHIPVTNRFHENNCNFFLSSIGKMYANGIPMNLDILYPKVKFPVSRGTGKLSHLLSWQHAEKWAIPDLKMIKSDITCHRIVNIKLDSDHSYMEGHRIDGRCLLPATGYLYLIWHQFCSFSNIGLYDNNIEFEDIRLMRATPLSTTKETTLDLLIFYGSGRFEISEKSVAIVTGFIRIMPEKSTLTDLPTNSQVNSTLLTNSDFYKELRLRGYQYQDDYKSVMEVSADGQSGKINWTNNWVSFMDCFLQLTILAEDSRSLYLPTRIRKINIFPKIHYSMVAEGNESIVDFKICPELGIIQGGGVEIHNVTANAVSRRISPGTLIRNCYGFVAHDYSTILTTIDSIRVCTQLAFENGLPLKVRAMEIKSETNEMIVDKMLDVLIQTPQIAFDLCLLTDEIDLELTNITVVNGKLSEQNNFAFIVASDCLGNPKFLTEIDQSLSSSGFLLCREKSVKAEQMYTNFNLIAKLKTPAEHFVLLQKIEKKLMLRSKVVHVKNDDNDFKWIDELNDFVKYGSVILVAQNEPHCGLLGLINCIRKEPKYKDVILVHVDDPKAPVFDLDNSFYSQQLNLGLAVNIYKNGKWGSYRHLELNEETIARAQSDHCYVSPQRKGDFSSLSWFNGPLIKNKIKNLATVQYCSLNFKDVMLTSGKIPVTLNRVEEYSYIGFEYSGINSKGKRVMGMASPGSLGTYAEMIDDMTFSVPDSMSLEEAATIPTVYLTVYYAFFMENPIVSGKSILIHAGSGGIGIAAITVALAYKMEVFTTVSTDVKKKFILEQFPAIKESHIGNSRDCSFERMVKIVTKGKGVDFVLNSLSGDKLKASIRCLGCNGTFLEIGKFDLANNNEIGLEPFLKELTFRSIMADRFVELERADRMRIKTLMEKDLKNGIIKPLPTTVFEVDEVEKAFRFLSTGKHIGKVLIQIRSDPFDKCSKPIKALRKSYFDMEKVYIIFGGLGGFGMELADWMILRGVRKIVLVSRQGVTTGYQRYRMSLWQSYGCKVMIFSSDCTTLAGCKTVIDESRKHGGIDGIFNLAAVLRDGAMETQTAQSFTECMAPKAVATKYLDQLSRVHCPKMNYFVVFSSVSCGHGNAGQANYGMANSVMERIVEKRVSDGLSGKAIQWGAVGEVGLVAEMTKGRLDIEIAGTLPQTIWSCLNELDSLLCAPEVIVKCMLAAEKKLKSSNTSIIDSVMHIMGIRDLSSVSPSASLSDLGMDSLTATEILQTMERDFNVIVSLNELRTLTLTKLSELSKGIQTSNVEMERSSSDRLVNFKYIFNDAAENQELVYRLTSLNNADKFDSCLVFLPGIDGVTKEWIELASKTHLPTFVVNIKQNTKSVDELVALLSEEMRKLFAAKKFFYLVSHSFGSLLAIEVARNLEAMNMNGHIICIDGSPSFAKQLCLASLQTDDSAANYEITLILSVVREINPAEDLKSFAEKLLQHATWTDKTDFLFNYLESINYPLVPSSVEIFNGVYKKMSGLMSYTFSGSKIKSNITLLRAKSETLANISETYDLDSNTDGKVDVIPLDGSHLTIIQNAAIVDFIKDLDPNNNKT